MCVWANTQRKISRQWMRIHSGWAFKYRAPSVFNLDPGLLFIYICSPLVGKFSHENQGLSKLMVLPSPGESVCVLCCICSLLGHQPQKILHATMHSFVFLSGFDSGTSESLIGQPSVLTFSFFKKTSWGPFFFNYCLILELFLGHLRKSKQEHEALSTSREQDGKSSCLPDMGLPRSCRRGGLAGQQWLGTIFDNL